MMRPVGGESPFFHGSAAAFGADAVFGRQALGEEAMLHRYAAEELGVAYTTAQRGIGKLESLSMFSQVGDARRGRVYCARELLDILEEPPRLTPA